MNNKKEKLVLLSLLFLILVSFPFISIPDKASLVGGLPMLYFYILIVWISAIALTFLITRKRNKLKE